jgi:hypothetical protein
VSCWQIGGDNAVIGSKCVDLFLARHRGSAEKVNHHRNPCRNTSGRPRLVSTVLRSMLLSVDMLERVLPITNQAAVQKGTNPFDPCQAKVSSE